jgi:predicted Zn-dependent protease
MIRPCRKAIFYTTAVLCLAAAIVTAFPAAAQSQQDEEAQVGQLVFNELKSQGAIIESSPLYGPIKPVTEAIIRVAQPQYNHPFQFYLIHGDKPNAFSTPGGNVYVVDSLLYFVRNTDEFAGTLCHEVAHTIHHDTMTLMEKQERLLRREIFAAILLGPTEAHMLAIALIGRLHSLSYSRDVESRADLTGSDLCADAGYNPWGLVWLLQDFKNSNPDELPQVLSDHPNNQNRINALEGHFRKNPSVFWKFNRDPKFATQLAVPKKTAERGRDTQP